MHSRRVVANVCLWPKADVETRRYAIKLNLCELTEDKSIIRYRHFNWLLGDCYDGRTGSDALEPGWVVGWPTRRQRLDVGR